MNRSRVAVPLLVATLVAALGSTSYAVVGHQHHDARAAAPSVHHAAKVQARPAATAKVKAAPGVARQQAPRPGAAARSTSVHSLLRGSYTAGSARLSGTTKPVVKNKRLPEITGRSVVGGTLVASGGKWSVSPVQLSFQWFTGGKAIKKATKPTFSPTAKNLAGKLYVEVTAKKKGYRTATADSKETGKVKPGKFESLKDPAITGKAKVGQKLSTTFGKWSVKGVELSFQWLRGGKVVAGATKDTYKLKSGDLGQKMSVTVTAELDGYKPLAVTTAATKPVVK